MLRYNKGIRRAPGVRAHGGAPRGAKGVVGWLQVE